MNILNRLILTLFVALMTAPSMGWSASAHLCRNLFTSSVDTVFIPMETYKTEVNDLRNTITGNLATTFRSEWKTKLEVIKSNLYVLNLVDKFLTAETAAYVKNGLDINSSGFVRQIHARLYDLQQKKMLKPEDELDVRDSPPPAGARDTTFTFYTKPISTPNGEGKHQVRLRTYLREVTYNKIPMGANVQGYTIDGHLITLTRVKARALTLTEKTPQGVVTERTLTFAQLTLEFGETMILLAPHGRTFKVEIKTALTDMISADIHENLAGPHMVQKVDFSSMHAQFVTLFAPLKNKTLKGKYAESVRRIEKLKTELIQKNPASKARIEAESAVFLHAVKNDPTFLEVKGATFYHRTALGTKTGLQTTIDRDQVVYVGDMYDGESLKSPIDIVKKNKAYSTKAKDARHVELKVPVTSMANTVGINFADPTTAPQPQNQQYEPRIREIIAVFNKFVKNAAHSGKFHYIQKNGISEEADVD